MMDQELKTKFTQFKKYCKGAFVRPNGIPDDWRWTTTVHILKAYYQKCIRMRQLPQSEWLDEKDEMTNLISILTDEIHPNDKLIIKYYVSEAIQDWFEESLEKELYEIAVNLKNIGDAE